MNLWSALAGADRGALHGWAGDRFQRTSWAELWAGAEGAAAELRRRGVRAGVPVATLLTNDTAVVRGLAAVWLAGGTVASLPVPARGVTREAYGKQLAGLLAHLGAPLLLLDDRLLDLVPERVRAETEVVTWGALARSGRLDPEPPGEDAVAFIQYSSGSTSVPKGCQLTTRAIASQLQMLLAVSGGEPRREVVGSFLPLSHDMGLFGCLLYAWAFDFDLALSTPERFVLQPRSWFADLAAFGATMTAGTSTALHLASRAQGARPLRAPLALRACVIGAERVCWETLERARAVFGPQGLAPPALRPAYGLAEATLAVTASRSERGPRALSVDPVELSRGQVVEADPGDPAALALVSNGPPCPGVEVTAGAGGTALEEIQVRSPSLASGYHGDPQRTRERFTGGWLRTGDLGFLRDGELYLAGRADDLVSVGGRKVHTREIEVALEALPSVRKGGTAIVDTLLDRESALVLLAELEPGCSDYRALAARAAGTAMRLCGVGLAACLFLARGALPRTPSGKIQRFRCRSLYLDDGLETLARVVLP